MSETGEQVFNAVQAFLARFVIYPSSSASVAHTLWIAHTWLMKYWDSTPRIAFLSPEPGSGKSRALEVTEPLVPHPVHAVNVTPAYLFRKVSDPKGCPTILYDEIDTVFGPKAPDNEGVRGMLNAGHRQGATAGRVGRERDEQVLKEFPAYCAVALAGLHDLPDTIMSRSVVVRMRRRAPDESVDPWRRRINLSEGEQLRDRITAWVETIKPIMDSGDYWPEMPEGIEDRNADVWEALLTVADLAGGRWPALARESAVALVAASRQNPPSIGIQLLDDLRKAFAILNCDKVRTDELLNILNSMEESPWATIRNGQPLNARGLSTRLGHYGIGSKSHRDGDKVFKGYDREQFTDAWKRYLPSQSSSGSVTSVTSVTTVTPQLESAEFVTGAVDVAIDQLPGKCRFKAVTIDVTEVTDVTATGGNRREERCECGADFYSEESVRLGKCLECRQMTASAI